MESTTVDTLAEAEQPEHWLHYGARMEEAGRPCRYTPPPPQHYGGSLSRMFPSLPHYQTTISRNINMSHIKQKSFVQKWKSYSYLCAIKKVNDNLKWVSIVLLFFASVQKCLPSLIHVISASVSNDSKKYKRCYISKQIALSIDFLYSMKHFQMLIDTVQ